MQKINRIILSFFGLGYLPFSQGTFASIAGLGVALLIKNAFYYLAVTSVFIILGIILLKKTVQNNEDPPWVVIDEVSGIMITYLFLPKTINIFIAGFILFRFFDISKTFSIRKLERLKGGWGIMLDDIAAGLISNVILQVIFKFASKILV